MSSSLLVKLDLFLMLVSLIGMLFLWLDKVIYHRRQNRFYNQLSRHASFVGNKIDYIFQDITDIEQPVVVKTKKKVAKNIRLAQIRNLLDRADIFSTRKNWPEAEKLIIEAMSIDEDNIEALFALAKIYLFTKRGSKALILLEEIKEKKQKMSQEQHYELYMRLAEVHEQMDQSTLGIAYLNELLTHNKRDLALMLKIGEMLLTAERKEEALAILEQALQINNSDVNILKIAQKLAEDLQENKREEAILTKLILYAPREKHYQGRLNILHTKNNN